MQGPFSGEDGHNEEAAWPGPCSWLGMVPWRPEPLLLQCGSPSGQDVGWGDHGFGEALPQVRTDSGNHQAMADPGLTRNPCCVNAWPCVYCLPPGIQSCWEVNPKKMELEACVENCLYSFWGPPGSFAQMRVLLSTGEGSGKTGGPLRQKMGRGCV